ncbi:MAG: TetR family transcriptional regulator [Pseudomonadales bacterium]|nr:TetR family transcriptional regulator [Pseudomonadales bacterium]
MARNPPTAPYSLRRVPKQKRAKATVAAVLDASARILIDVGYSKASTNLIAETAGVSIGSLYEYFPGKEAIFAELRRREGMKTYEMLVGEPRPVDPIPTLEHLVTTYIARFRDNRELLVALENEVPRFAIADAEQAIIDEYMPMSDAFFITHKEKLKPKNEIPFISEFLVRAVCSTIVDYAKYSPESLSNPELAEAVIEMIGGWLLLDP